MNASAYLIEENVTQIKSGIVIVRENKIEDSQIKCDETINEADSVAIKSILHTVVISDHIAIYNCYCFLSLCKKQVKTEKRIGEKRRITNYKF